MSSQLVLADVRIPSGADDVTSGSIVTEGPRIVAIGSDESLIQDAQRAGAAVLNMNGAYVMPGIINMHVHFGLKLPGADSVRLANEDDAALALRMSANARAALLAGVTTVRLLSERGTTAFSLKSSIDRRESVGPRIYAAGTGIATTGGHGHESGAVEADGAWEMRKRTREQIKVGADLIKVMASGGIAGQFEGRSGAQLERDELGAIIDVAHSWGKKVTAHAGPAEVVRMAVELGVDCIEHGYGLTDEVASLMADRGTWFVPTLSVTRCRSFFEKIQAPDWMIERALSGGERHLAGFRSALNNGVSIALGTDMLPAEPYDGTTATVRELEHMVEAGMPTDKAIMAATAGPAEWLGASEVLGSLEVGKLADIIALTSNPFEDISALRGISFVMKDGVVYRDELTEKTA